jgi:hypothetical protein
MKGKQLRDPGNRAVVILATSIVVTLGLGVCLAVSFSAAGNTNGVWYSIACFAGIILVLWGMFESADRPVGDRNLLFFWRRKKKPDDYIVVRRRELSPEEFPENTPRPQPPSAESVRRIREEHATKTWVPSPFAPRENETRE